jgi:hypothetical protein
MMNYKLYGITAICLVLAFLLMVKSCELERAKRLSEQVRIPDTVYVSKPYKVVEIKKEYIEKPVKVYVYPKDTALREKAESSDIITGFNYKKSNLFRKYDFIKIDKISPQGIITSNEYQVEPVREIKLDLNGNLQVKKKRYIGLKIIAGSIAIGTTGFFIHQHLKK